MKILMLTPYLPYPPASGGQIRTLYLLKYLSQNHEITLVSLYKNEKEKEYARHLKSFCKNIYLCKRAEKPWQLGNILSSIFSFLPFLIVRNYSVEAKKTIEKLLKTERFDVIHAETFYIMPPTPKTSIPILLVEQTIEFKVYQHFISHLPFIIKLGLVLDILKLRAWEIHYGKKASLGATGSDTDKKTIQSIAPLADPVVIPNGAGDEMFVDSLPEKKFNQPKLLFMGNFYWLQNVEAAEYLINKIFPQIKKQVPDISLIIAGQNTTNKIKIEKTNQIAIINIAPDDTATVKKLYSEATLFVSPIFGPGGTRLKILAAMASGLPVISTLIGIEGLGVEEKKHVLTAKSLDDFTNNILLAIPNHSLYYHIQNQTFSLVKQKYSWPSLAKQLEIAYQQITN